MAKETLIIGEYVRSFNYLRRQGFCKKAKNFNYWFERSFFQLLPKGEVARLAETGVGYANADAFAYLPKGETLQAKTFQLSSVIVDTKALHN